MTLRQQRPAATPGTQRFPRPAFASRTRSLPRSADPVVPNRAPGITDETCDIPRLSGRLLRALYRRSGDGGAPGSQIERFLAPSGLAILMWSIRKPNSPLLPRAGGRGSGDLSGVDVLASPCAPSPVSAIRTPKLPLLPQGEKGVRGMREKERRDVAACSSHAGAIIIHHCGTGAPDPSPAPRAADRLPQA